MELPRPVLPSQRYSPNTSTADYYDRRQQVPGARQPLRESSGNAQPQHLGALTLCSQNLSALTSLPHSIPTPPIVPTQSLDSHYGPGSNLKLRRHQLHLQRRQRHGINPIYLSPQFQAYRKKQAEKDYKTAQIWPDFLEDAFLDALLLIPQMGRRKYTMRGQQHGRNMLISEYLWVAYCLSLPPGEKPSKLMRRERKQVSSHIQVLKNFFIHHRCYHFFFPGKEKKDDRRDSIETESFKDNPVLRALSEGRLPDERPNYEYFAQLLASDALVTVRPSLCWILVSNNSVEVEMDGPLRGTGFAPSGEKLNPKLYPHLGLNLKREEWPERGKIIRGTLLQEYARTLSQKEASSVKELSQDWEENFPDLYTPLEEVVQNNLRDILHFHVTLDVQEPDQFPEGSELNSLVEITIEQPALQNHTWKAVTRLARPWQLTRDEKTDPPVVEVTREMGVQYVHRQGCENHSRCDCSVTARLRRQQLAVPFPAPEWATMLSHLATFAKHPQVNKSKVKVEYDEKGNRTHASKEPTQMDLVKKIAMFQELWSCPPGSGQWTRRAVILWTFETMHGLDDKGKIINNSVGTTWRFLTAIDPTSQYHQQHALVSGSSQPPVNRDAIMSPGPGYQQHLTAAMNENFGSAWDQQSPLGMPSGHHGSVPYGPGAISILDSLPHGLATPPPSASFHSAYANGLGPTHQHDMNGHLSFMSNPAMDTKSTMMSAPDSLYATAGGVSVYDESPVDCDPSSSFQGWDANSMPAMDARLQPSWTTNFDFSGQGPPQHGNPSHMWNHGLAPSDSKPNVSSSHWAATVATADDKGDAAAWNGQPQSWIQTVATGDGSGAAPPTWDDSMPPPSSDATAPQGVPTAPTAAPQFHRSRSNQGVRNQLSRSATTGSLAGPRAGQKRGRSDSLDERDEYPLTSMPKLSHHVSVANAKYAAAVSAAGTPAPPPQGVDGGADQTGSGGEPW